MHSGVVSRGLERNDLERVAPDLDRDLVVAFEPPEVDSVTRGQGGVVVCAPFVLCQVNPYFTSCVWLKGTKQQIKHRSVLQRNMISFDTEVAYIFYAHFVSF